jgi:hypothetical protein
MILHSSVLQPNTVQPKGFRKFKICMNNYCSICCTSCLSQFVITVFFSEMLFICKAA